MRLPNFKYADWALLLLSIAMLGASTAVEGMSRNIQLALFWGGVTAFGWLMVIWYWPGKRKEAETLPAGIRIDARGGAFVGGDNNGTQQVFHGPVNIHNAPHSTEPLWPDRTFLPSRETPLRLISHYKGKTEIQGHALVKPFIGKWMRVSGKVADVSPMLGSFQLSFVNNTKQFMSPISFNFDATHADALHALKAGDKITVVGQIRQISPNRVALDNCEIVPD